MQLAISDIHLYEMLKSKTGQQESETFIQMLEDRVKNEAACRVIMIADKQDMSRVITKVEVKLSKVKIDIIKWMIGTGILGILTVFIKSTH